MNAGLSNLDSLKKHLLAASLQGTPQFDQVILDLGLGAAHAIEKFCNRKLGRLAGAVEILPADRADFILSRFPLESVSLIEQKLTEADGWIIQNATTNLIPNTIDLANGIIMFPDGSDCGPYYAQMRFTYTGGFWWEPLEPSDAGYPSAVPDGANALPADIRLAWLMQCEKLWAQRDKLGLGLIDKPDAQSAVSSAELIPAVKEMLQHHVRYQMT